MHEHFESQFGSRVSGLHGGDDLAHVAGDSGNSEQARFRVQQIVELLSGGFSLAHQVGEDSGVERARSCAHHQSVKRSEAHGRVDAAAVANRSEGAAVSQMAGHKFQGIEFAAEKLGSTLRAILMIDSVKTVTANSLSEPFERAGIDGSSFR